MREKRKERDERKEIREKQGERDKIEMGGKKEGRDAGKEGWSSLTISRIFT